MKRFLKIVFAALLSTVLLCACGKKQQEKTIVEIKGPEGLVAEFSGIKLNGNDNSIRCLLAQGEYVFGFTAPGYRSEYRKVAIPKKQKFTYEVKLAPVTAATLITTAPAGAEVTMDGKVMGITPLVIKELPKGEYMANIAMKGYAPMALKWRIDSGRPVKAHGVLESNLGTLVVESEPGRARVFIDGEEVGETPYKIQRPEGKYVVRLVKAACNPEERNVNILKRRVTSLRIKLGEKPGGIKVSSNPAGAEVMINGIKRGVTPCTVEALEPGKYDMKLIRKGYDPIETGINIVAGGIDSKHYNLISSTGSVIFNVRPAGVEVFLNNRSLGFSAPRAPGAEATCDFRVDNLAPGKYTIAMHHSLGDPQKQYHTFRVRKNETTTIRNLVVWISNCEITYSDNTREKGLLVESHKDHIVFSPEPGVKLGIKRNKLKKIIMLKGAGR